MRKIIVSEFLTLDGVMQAPGGKIEDTEGGFAHGGWQMPYADAVFGEFVTQTFADADTLLLGRKTYDIFAGYWPKAPTGEYLADTINSMAKYAVSRTKDNVDWNNSFLIKNNVVEEITKLKQQPGKNILVIGSGELVQTLIQNNLVDECSLMIHPLILGSGKRLFKEGLPKKLLKLMDSKISTTGVVILTYSVA